MLRTVKRGKIGHIIQFKSKLKIVQVFEADFFYKNVCMNYGPSYGKALTNGFVIRDTNFSSKTIGVPSHLTQGWAKIGHHPILLYRLAMAKPRLFLDRRPSSFPFVPKKDKPSFFFMTFLSK